MFDKNILWKDWWIRIKCYNPCAKPCDTIKWDYFTIGKVLQLELSKEEATRFQSWAMWALIEFGKEMTSELRLLHLNKIKHNIAANFLYKKLDWLTTEEKKVLKDVISNRRVI